ncbi:hypothetical protein HMPREF3216_01124 [Gardnerella vaginalis]|uniref:Uncharacterized protein n=1 Tax=Gardnerella vaginalis TaxID=2702 RepID=A0A133NMK6_GARVA|nr:hypothetical protein HMPREF3216_01124 [Gardnerella vaginalis]
MLAVRLVLENIFSTGGGVYSFQRDFTKYLWIKLRIDDFELHNFPVFVYFFLLLFPKLTKKGTNAGKREQTRAKSTTKTAEDESVKTGQPRFWVIRA